MSRRLLVALVAVTAVFAGASSAFAVSHWTKSNTGSGAAKAGSLTTPGTPALNGSASSSSVPLTWTASTGGSGTVKYHVERAPFGGSTWTDVCSSTDAAPITGTTCSDGTVAASTDYQYRVTAELSKWRNTSGTSAKISTPAPPLTITSGTRTGSNATFSGSNAVASTTITVTVCDQNVFPCTGTHIKSTASKTNPTAGAWTSGNTGTALTGGTTYWAQAVQGSNTSAAVTFTYPTSNGSFTVS